MSGLNLKFSSTFFTASLPLTQSQIPNPKFPQFQQYSFRNRQTKRCGFIAAHADSSGLPLLPFDINQSLFRKKKLFVHFVLDPVIVGDSSAGSSFAARYGCLVIIENVERLDVGALVSIRGIGRVKIMEFVQADPYLKGIVIPMQDNIFECESEISSKVSELKEALYSLNSLEIKLKAPKEELLQTCIAKSLMWAEKEPSVDCDEAFVPSLAERISFAALQPVTGKCVCDPFLFSIAIEIHLSSMSSHIFVRSLKMILLLTALTKAFSSFFCLQFKPNYVSGALY
ncbi:uncharacterized protein LOC100244294 isoform X5 [Vitis vinifera]|uniref:uncharacterized protein LOC100244294 isoform X5 n=1 Tax=Vitis vinifera TaxID=29760 RepID=UPI0028831714|nr:uncharacterized protein LOC100244294 isoform X5 [Vitis vinifera]